MKGYIAALLALGVSLAHPGARAEQPYKNPAAGKVLLQTPNPSTPIEHNNRGVELGSKFLWQDAIREHEMALKLDPHNKLWKTNLSAAHLEYGKFLKSKNQNTLAAKEFRLALSIDSQNMSAEAELDKVLKTPDKDSQDYAYRRGLAVQAVNDGDFGTAVVEWRKCKKLRDDPLTQALLGKALIKNGQDVEGFEELKAAVGRSGWPAEQQIDLAACHRELAELLKNLADKAMKDGRKETGLKRLSNSANEFRRAVTMNSADGRSIQGLTDVALQVVALNPNSFDNHMLLFGAYLLGADFAHAKQELGNCKKLVKDKSQLNDAWTSYYRALARSPITQDNLIEESIADLSEELKKNPDDGKKWATLGLLYLRQKKYDPTKQCFDKSQENGNIVSKDPELEAGVKQLHLYSEANVDHKAETSGHAN